MPKQANVMKVLSPEEKTILANIESLVSQLRQMEEGAGNGEGEEDNSGGELELSKSVHKEKGMDANSIKQKLLNGESLEDEERLFLIESLGGNGKGVVEEAMPESDEDEEEEDEVEIEMDKATASDSADERIADNQEESTGEATGEAGDNMKQIVRSILSETMKAVDEKLEPIKKSQQEQGEAFTNLLDAIGLLKEVEKSADEEKEEGKVKKAAKSGKPQVTLTFEQAQEIMKGAQHASAEPQDEGRGMVEPFDVRKSTAASESRHEMAKAMGAIFGVNNNSNGRF